MPIALFIGRFQPLHIGHEMLIDNALKQVDKLYIFISADKKEDDLFSVMTRFSFIYNLYDNLIDNKIFLYTINDIGLKDPKLWYIYVLGKLSNFVNINDNKIIFFLGNDISYFDDNIMDMQYVDIEKVIMERQNNISGTYIRKMIKEKRFKEIENLVNHTVYKYITNRFF